MQTCFRFRAVLLILFGLAFIPRLSAQTRDPLKWPFSERSIWNLPIHNNATYVPAGMTQANSNSFSTDEDIIILSPSSPNLNVETNYTDWNAGGNARCSDQGPTLFSAPIPANWIYDNTVWQGTTPNAGAAILRADGKIIQTQPFAKCNTTYATSHYVWSADNCVLTGECIAGAHGGSGLSAIGGTIRVGEFTAGAIRHVMKFNVWAKYFLSNANGGYRWPALKADGGYNVPGEFNYYGGSNTAMKMGSLLALHKTATISTMGFETEPGKILAKAFQDYGAYIVDNTGWDHCAIPTEIGPDGSVLDEFRSLYGFDFSAWGNLDNSAWGRDIKRIITNLYVINNNSAGYIGGGPTNDNNRRAPIACPLGTQGSGQLCGSTSSSAPQTGSIIWLKSEANGKYLCADLGISSNAPLYANRDNANGNWGKFQVTGGGNNVFYLKSLANNKYVMANQNDGSKLYALGEVQGTWEAVKFEVQPDGKLAIRYTVNNKLVCADNYFNNQLIANRDNAGGWEKFVWGTTTAARMSVEEASQEENALLEVYPVPARDAFTVLFHSPSEQTIQVHLTDLYSRSLQQISRRVKPGPNQIDLRADQLPSGLYFVRVAQSGKTLTSKVIVTR